MAAGRPSAEVWPQIADIAVNHDGWRPETTNALTGQSVAVRLEDELILWLVFVGESELDWTLADRSVKAQAYEAFAVRDACYFIDFVDRENDLRSCSIWLDLNLGAALLIEGSVENRALEKADLLTRVRLSGSQSVASVRVRRGTLGAQAALPAFPRSTALLGRFLRYEYSDTHIYDHYYIDHNYYAWYCWRGPDAGLGDVDEVDCLDLGDDLFLVCWREKLLPCLAVTVEDYGTMRTIGKIFGADSTSWRTTNKTIGARMHLIARIPAVSENA